MFDLPPDPFSVEGRLELIEQQREVIALWETEYSLCNEVMGRELPFMGTSQAAKDIERMSDVFGGKDALINFVRSLRLRFATLSWPLKMGLTTIYSLVFLLSSSGDLYVFSAFVRTSLRFDPDLSSFSSPTAPSWEDTLST